MAPATQPAPAGTQVLAVVNGENITQADMDALLKACNGAPAGASDIQRDQQRMHALYMLVDQRLMSQFLARHARPIDPGEIDKKLADISKAVLQQGKTLSDYCKEVGQSEANLREGLTRLLQWYSWAGEHVKEEDVQKYYQDYKDFFDQVKVRISHIVLRVPYPSTAADREQFHARLKDIQAAILAGKMDFATAAKQYSHCTMSKDKGGDLGFIQRKYMVEESLSRAAFALKPGQISEPIDSEFGVHLILVTERTPGTPTDYARIKDAVREEYIAELSQKVLDEQRKTAKIEFHLPGMSNGPAR
jgi:peptidyl-prolyl cis-trans isomerase C